MFTNLYLIMSVYKDSAWDILAGVMAYGGAGCVLSPHHVRAAAGVNGTVDDCVVVSINTSYQDVKEIMYDLIVPHSGKMYLDVQ